MGKKGTGKKEPFSIFSHTIECFAYLSVLSLGAATILSLDLFDAVCGKNGIVRDKKKHTQQVEIYLGGCFRSFVV